MRDDVERLKDILEAIEQIEKYSVNGRSAFEKDELIQTWVIHHLLILGEAAAKVTEEFREENADIPWSNIIGMRNILIHHYFGIDLDVVWAVVEKDMPNLKGVLKGYL